MVCPHGQGGVEHVPTFFGKRKREVNLSQFCADVLYGRAGPHGQGGVEHVPTFFGKRERKVNLSQFCADVLYGRAGDTIKRYK